MAKPSRHSSVWEEISNMNPTAQPAAAAKPNQTSAHAPKPNEAPSPAKQRRKRNRVPGSTSEANVRFFLGKRDPQTGLPNLQQECPTELDAMEQSVTGKQTFFRVEEWQTCVFKKDGALLVDKVPARRDVKG
jgi:hypothetical protein